MKNKLSQVGASAAYPVSAAVYAVVVVDTKVGAAAYTAGAAAYMRHFENKASSVQLR